MTKPARFRSVFLGRQVLEKIDNGRGYSTLPVSVFGAALTERNFG